VHGFQRDENGGREINAAGRINGRKIKLIVEDSGYDPKTAVLASQKMVERDKIFAMVGPMGSRPFSRGRISCSTRRAATLPADLGRIHFQVRFRRSRRNG